MVTGAPSVTFSKFRGIPFRYRKMKRSRIIFAGGLLAVSILFMEINFKEKNNSIKAALENLRGDYLNSKKLELLLIHKIRPIERTIKVIFIENSFGDHKMITLINWDNFFWATRRAITNPDTKLGLYLREKNTKPPIFNDKCREFAYISYQRLRSP